MSSDQLSKYSDLPNEKKLSFLSIPEKNFPFDHFGEKATENEKNDSQRKTEIETEKKLKIKIDELEESLQKLNCAKDRLEDKICELQKDCNVKDKHIQKLFDENNQQSLELENQQDFIKKVKINMDALAQNNKVLEGKIKNYENERLSMFLEKENDSKMIAKEFLHLLIKTSKSTEENEKIQTGLCKILIENQKTFDVKII